MIRGIHATLIVAENYFQTIAFYRDHLRIAMIREYKAGGKHRDGHGSPSWAEFPGTEGGPNLVVAAQGVFGDEPVSQPALILDSTHPIEDGLELASVGFAPIGEPIRDRWWHDIVLMQGPDGVLFVLVGNTGDKSEAIDAEGRELATADV